MEGTGRNLLSFPCLERVYLMQAKTLADLKEEH